MSRIVKHQIKIRVKPLSFGVSVVKNWMLAGFSESAQKFGPPLKIGMPLRSRQELQCIRERQQYIWIGDQVERRMIQALIDRSVPPHNPTGAPSSEGSSELVTNLGVS